MRGHQAEKLAALYLRQLGYRILGLNWRTRYCEIDIIAEKDRVAYLVEVKSRLTERQGRGLDYITAEKLRQMQFAAELWVARHGWRQDYCLAAIEVNTTNCQVTAFLTDI